MKSIQFRQIWSTQKIRKILIWNFCIIALVIVGVYSCTDKNEIADVRIVKNEQPITPRSPSTVSDRVYFDDYADFIDYYEDLDYILMTNNGDYFDSIVDLTTPVTTLNDLVASTAGYYGEVSDPSIRAIVNPYNEFQIDDILVTFINDDQLLLSDASNGTLKTAIRGITKGVKLDISNIPTGAQWATPDDLEESVLKFWCGCKIRIEVYNCDSIRVFGSCNGWFGSAGGGEVTITLGFDNAPDVEFLNEEVSNNFEFFVNISQFHGQPGFILAEANSNCDNASPVETSFNFDPEEFVLCDDDERTERATFTSANASERIKTLVYYKKSFGVTKTHNAEIWSESSSNSGVSWNPSKADMTVGVEANQKDFDCALIDSKDDEKSGKAKHLIVRVNWLASNMFHCTGDLIGYFHKERNNITIDEDLPVRFQCCEE